MIIHNHTLTKNTPFYLICQVKPVVIAQFVLFFSNYVHIFKKPSREYSKKAGPAQWAGPVFSVNLKLPD